VERRLLSPTRTMSHTEPDVVVRFAEEVDGVPACDWGGVLPGGRSSTSEPSSQSPESTTGLPADEDGLARLYRQLVRTESDLFLGTAERELVDNAKASKP
jgi:hypothetical protein